MTNHETIPYRSTTPRRLAGLLLLALLPFGLAACDDASLMPPAPEGGEIFESYVALGASVTAGVQSGGINAETQREAYPALLAEAMGTRFNLPLLRSPGCPPPFTDILAGERLAGGTAETCALREPPEGPIHNLAVPNAEVSDLLRNSGAHTNANALTQFILGGRTQIGAAAEADPSFVTVFAGGGNLLDGLQSGDPSTALAPDQFAQEYGELAQRLNEIDPEGVVLIGVPNLIAFDEQGRGTFPFLSLGAAYFQASQSPAWPSTFDVSANCAPESVVPDGQPGHQSAVPFGYGFGQLFAAARQGQNVELDCLADPQVLTVSELQQVGGLLQQYNQSIAGIAQENGWAFVDLTPLIGSFRDQGLIPPFPTITDPSAPLFGPIFSQDGIHLSGQGHRAVAGRLAEQINGAFGTSLSVPEGGS